jgi:sugar lactone lactonase YvrE
MELYSASSEQAMKAITPKTLVKGFKYLEGPRWHEDRIWMSDVLGCKVVTVDLLGRVNEVVSLPGMPSGLGFLPDGTPLIVSMADRCLFRLDVDQLVCHAALGSLVTGPTNDMVVDDLGRAYVGDYGYDSLAGEEFRSGNLVLVTPDGEARVVAEDLAGPNGMVILRNRALLVVAETRGGKLTAFDIAADGILSGRRVYAELGEHMPDGICLDENGGIWVASFAGGAFFRVLEGGAISHNIDVAGRLAVACQLGGKDRRTLFCLTYAGTWEDVCAGRSQATVEIAKVDVAGAGSP